MKNKQFEQFRNEVKQFLGDGLVGEIGPDQGQFAFATSEPDLGPDVRAKSLDGILEIKAKYPQLSRCAVMPFAVSGRTIYCIAGLNRLPQD